MRARCERHGLALGPSGCLLCRREQGTAAAIEAASLNAQGASASADTTGGAVSAAAPAAGAGALPPFEPVPSAAPFARAFAVAPTIVAALDAAPPAVADSVSADSAAAAPAPATPPASPLPDPGVIVTDFPPPRQLSIQIPPFALLLPFAALALYLLVTNLPKQADSAAATAELAAPAQQAAGSPGSAARAEADEEADAPEQAAPDENAPAGPELSPAEIERLRERTRQAKQLADAREHVKVAIYYTERCPRCSEARAYLTSHGIRAQQHDIDKDPKARARFKRLNPKGSLPTIVVEKQTLKGFDADRVEQALDRAARKRLGRKR